jgi:TolB protein
LVRNRDGSGEKRLTFRRRYDAQPAISPDGQKIAFSSDGDGNAEIYIMNSGGTGLLRITRDLADDNYPSWSNDGTEIFFASNRSGKYAIYRVKIN